MRKTRMQMDQEELAGDSLDVWKEGVIEKYKRRPHHKAGVSLAQFVACYYKTKGGQYKRRNVSKIIRYRNYDMSEIDEYKREMTTLHIPFFSEEVELLDNNKFLQIYNENEAKILEARKEFESNIDTEKTMEYSALMAMIKMEKLKRRMMNLSRVRQ